MSTNVIAIQKNYNASPETIWKALTDVNEMKLWYFDIKEFKAEPGFEFTFTGARDEKNFLHRCRVIEAIPEKRLSYSWRYDGFEGNTTVTFELKSNPDQTTTLNFTHSGLETFPASEPDLSTENFREGWEHILGENLANMVETEIIRLAARISATPEKILQVLTHPNHSWASAFGGGALAKTDWKEGSPITWTDMEETIGARGVIKTKNLEKLEMQYFDEAEPVAGEELGDYVERFSLKPTTDGHTELNLEAGPLSRLHISHHKAAWEKALPLICKTAEK